MMKTLAATFLIFLAAFAAKPADAAGSYRVASGNCAAAVQQAAASTGGQVISVQLVGATCVVTVLVPPSGNFPARRLVLNLPAG